MPAFERAGGAAYAAAGAFHVHDFGGVLTYSPNFLRWQNATFNTHTTTPLIVESIAQQLCNMLNLLGFSRQRRGRRRENPYITRVI